MDIVNSEKQFNINDITINDYNTEPADFNHILKETTTPGIKKKKKKDDDDDDNGPLSQKDKDKRARDKEREAKLKAKIRKKKKEDKIRKKEELKRLKAEAMEGTEEQQRDLTVSETISAHLTSFKEFIFGKPENDEEKRRRLQEEERLKEIQRQEALLKEQKDNVILMESLFSIRSKQRDMDAIRDDFLHNYMGVGEGAAADEYFTEANLITAARNGNFSRLIDILDSKTVKINKPDQDEGVTALWVSLEALVNETTGKPPIEVDIPNIDDYQGLHIRIKNKVVRFITNRKQLMQMDLVIRILLYKGANIDFVKRERDGDGYSALHLAADKPAPDIVRFILNRRGDINVRSSLEKRTPLMIAIMGDYIDVVLLLLQEGAMLTINSACRKGWTALHYGACFGSPDLVMVLLLCGSDVFTRNKSGNSPLEEAIARGRSSVVEVLRTFKSVADDFKDRMRFLTKHYHADDDDEKKKKKKKHTDDNDDNNDDN